MNPFKKRRKDRKKKARRDKGKEMRIDDVVTIDAGSNSAQNPNIKIHEKNERKEDHHIKIRRPERILKQRKESSGARVKRSACVYRKRK